MAALLHQLEDMAGAILTEVLRFEVVAADPESPASNPVPDARFEQWLRHQTYEYDAAVKQSEANALMDPSPIDPESPEYLAQLKKLDALRNELREVRGCLAGRILLFLPRRQVIKRGTRVLRWQLKGSEKTCWRTDYGLVRSSPKQLFLARTICATATRQ
eukprot:m.178014 g.178014  ORF g.178014 m.178014 type:complete len:160 (+) comp17974_c0_seq8:292-771(+)